MTPAILVGWPQVDEHALAAARGWRAKTKRKLHLGLTDLDTLQPVETFDPVTPILFVTFHVGERTIGSKL